MNLQHGWCGLLILVLCLVFCTDAGALDFKYVDSRESGRPYYHAPVVYGPLQRISVDGKHFHIIPSRWHRYEVSYQEAGSHEVKVESLVGTGVQRFVDEIRANGGKIMSIESIVSVVP